MAKKSRGGGTPAIRQLQASGVSFTSHPYTPDPASPSYGLEAAQALGVDPASVFKTLLANAEDALVVAIVPVTTTMDLKALARELGSKRASMAGAAEAERATGYVVGGISPLGQRRSHQTFLDQSARALPRMYVSGGRRGLDIGIAPDDLIRLTKAKVARIAAPTE